MSVRWLPIACLCVLAAANQSSARASQPADDEAAIRRMVASLNADVLDSDARKALFTLPRLAPTNKAAQQATVRYVERVVNDGRAAYLSHARSLSRYGEGFSAEVMRSLAKRREGPEGGIWLLTLALMGKKAAGQSAPLAAYLREELDPVCQMRVRIALVKMDAAPADNGHVIDREIGNRTQAGLAAVSIAAVVGFQGWASENAVSEVKRWLAADVPEDDRCNAALALAVSGCREESVQSSLRELLDKSTKPPQSGSTSILYAYALALLDERRAEVYWRIIFKKMAYNANHTDGFAADLVAASIPVQQCKLVERLHKDPDPKVAAQAAEWSKFLGWLIDDLPVKSAP